MQHRRRGVPPSLRRPPGPARWALHPVGGIREIRVALRCHPVRRPRFASEVRGQYTRQVRWPCGTSHSFAIDPPRQPTNQRPSLLRGGEDVFRHWTVLRDDVLVVYQLCSETTKNLSNLMSLFEKKRWSQILKFIIENNQTHLKGRILVLFKKKLLFSFMGIFFIRSK